jgi:Glycosyltransferase family 28 C-terminal domain
VWNTDHALFDRVLDAIRALPISLVVTLGRDADPAVLGERPPNVHVHGFIRHEQLTAASAAVSHGGAGTLLGALADRLPLLLLRQGADQFLNAARAARAGAAVRLLAHERSATTIRNAVATLLDDPRRTAPRAGSATSSSPCPAPARRSNGSRRSTSDQTRLHAIHHDPPMMAVADRTGQGPATARTHSMHAAARRLADGLERDGDQLVLDPNERFLQVRSLPETAELNDLGLRRRLRAIPCGGPRRRRRSSSPIRKDATPTCRPTPPA